MSSDDESDEISVDKKINAEPEVPSSRQAKKVARLKQILYQNEHRDRIKKVSSILKKKEHEITNEEKEILRQSPEITNRLSKLKERRGTLKLRQLEIEDPLEELEAKCQDLANAIRHSNRVVVYTGAGISTAASIPDYRGPNGVWTLLQKGQQPKAQDLCDAKPTLTHMSIKKLQDEGHVTHVVSQNCDGLHMRSGLNRRQLSEVHGNMYIEICYNCRPHQEYIRLFDVTEKTGVRRHQTDRNCHTCKEPLKDTIVHFGEKGGMKCPYRWKEAAKAADKCDIILCLGSSLKILKKYSCLWCMDRRMKDRPKLYIVNLQWTPRDDAATVKINGRCDDVMKYVMRDLGYEIPIYLEEEDPIFSLATHLLKDETETTRKKIMEKPDPSTKMERIKLRKAIVAITSPKRPTFKSNIEPISVNDNKAFNHVIKSEPQNSNHVVTVPKTDQKIKTEPQTMDAKMPNHVSMGCNPTINHHPLVPNHTLVNPFLFNPNDAIRSVLENKHSLDFTRLNGLLSTPPVFPYHPFSSLPLGIPAFRPPAKFGEVSFPKYIDREGNHAVDLKHEQSRRNFNKVDQNLGLKATNQISHANMTCMSSRNSVTVKTEQSVVRSTQSSVSTVQTSTSSALSGHIKTETNSQNQNKNVSPSNCSVRSRRVRKSFCPHCHGVSGSCPCTLLESSKKKPQLCKACHKNPCVCSTQLCKTCHKNPCVCSTMLCLTCRKSSNKCDCSQSECVKCRMDKCVCTCSQSIKQSVCQMCKQMSDKCTCVAKGHCSICKVTKSLCKCVSSNTSSISQVGTVPNNCVVASGQMIPRMSIMDYARFPMNHYSPFYMPQVFQNTHMNCFLPGIRPMLPSNNLGLLTNNQVSPNKHVMNGLLPGNSFQQSLKVEPILQDHSYLDKDQMKSLSPNCDNSNQRSPKDTSPVSKLGRKRSYSYVDDIQPADEDQPSNQKIFRSKSNEYENSSASSSVVVSSPVKVNSCSKDVSPSKVLDLSKTNTILPSTEIDPSKTNTTLPSIRVESSSPIIVDEEDQSDEKVKDNQEKPKLLRSVSVPGWFGKGLNLKKRRR